MAADERKVVIWLKSEDSNGGQKDNASPEDNKVNPEENANKSPSAAIAIFAAERLASAITSEALNWAKFEIDKSLNLDDNYMAQRDLSIALQLIGKETSFMSTIVGFAVSGAMIGGGPIGAAVGAAIGTAVSIASTVRENTQSIIQEDIMLRQMESQLSYTRQRAGWSTKAASIGEDL